MTKEKCKLLIVDDEDDIRELLIAFFSKENYEIYEAADGEQAKKIVLEKKINVMLTDIFMPVLDGLSLCKQLFRENIPVTSILVTAHGDLGEAKDAIEYGVFDFINKPFKKEVIINRVRRAAEKNMSIQAQNQMLDLLCESLNIDKKADIFTMTDSDKYDLLQEVTELIKLKKNLN
jgi:DNA-binding NtrC family response regulator